MVEFHPSVCSEPKVIAKSNVVLDVKPWDDETGEHHWRYCSSTNVYKQTCMQTNTQTNKKKQASKTNKTKNKQKKKHKTTNKIQTQENQQANKHKQAIKTNPQAIILVFVAAEDFEKSKANLVPSVLMACSYCMPCCSALFLFVVFVAFPLCISIFSLSSFWNFQQLGFHILTDMKEMERLVREVQADGLLWGASKLVPLAYGIKKLQISCVIEDDKISTDFLEEEITKNEDLVQSVDIAAFNKV